MRYLPLPTTRGCSSSFFSSYLITLIFLVTTGPADFSLLSFENKPYSFRLSSQTLQPHFVYYLITLLVGRTPECSLRSRSSLSISHSLSRKSHSLSENKPSSLSLQFLCLWLSLPELQTNIFIAHWATPSRGPTNIADSACLKLNFFSIQLYFSCRLPILYEIFSTQPNALTIPGSFPTTVTACNQQRLLTSIK